MAGAEAGDSGDLPASAQEPGPQGPLAQIDGTVSSPADRDMFKVCLTGGSADFSATTIGGAGFDTQLFLFNSEGRGVYANDDFGAPQSGLPPDHRLTPTARGVYYLAISTFDWDPVSFMGRIFPTSSGVVGPTRMGGMLPISGWTASDQTVGGTYTIFLTGTRSCVDTTAPTVTVRTPPEGAEYARGQQVLADYECADEAEGSGLASCQGSVPDGSPIDTATLGTKSFTVTALDARGNRTSVTHSYRVVDRTPPLVNLHTPPEGAVYARGEEVPVAYDCTDDAGGSGVASCSGDVAPGAHVDTSTLGPHSFTVTAVDGEGNRASVTHSYRVADRTAPTVVVGTPAEGAVYALGATVLADYECADEGGGSGLASCSGDVADGAPIDTSSVGSHSFRVTATDAEGNSSSVERSYTVEDRSGPAIDIRSPRDRGTYKLGQRVLAVYGCSDEPGGAGLLSCVGSVPAGAPIDTASLGEHSFSVRAEDAAGNVTTQTVTYRVLRRVVFDFQGFLRPVANRPSVNSLKGGWIVPMMFSLDGFKGLDVVAKGYPRSRQIPCGSKADADGGEPTRHVGRTPLRYRRGHDSYLYLWKTEQEWAGTCRQFILKLSDGSYHRADFRFFGRSRHD
jgi:hypothetical protein